MSNDFSRIRFDVTEDQFGVLLQQGRPLAESDWNALVAQITRRTHVGSLDTFGPAIVPEQTPEGFHIIPGGGNFTIGAGRIYVDGLLAENHGSGPLHWDVHASCEVGSNPISYDSQPYLPNALALPAAGSYIAYVDVWQREVGALQDESLVDIAIGVDTCARLQTVWQVRALAVADDTDCSTPLDTIPGWDDVTAPSSGRLTTAAGDVPGEPDPCLVPPLGGYKGGENQLYRVEVQKAGVPGTATFKWSRNDASLEARIQRIPDLGHLVVDSVGKDDVLRIQDGDWIEILDDVLELSGQPGVLRQVAPVN